MATTTTTETLHHVIAGESSGRPDRERRNPADRNDVVARFPSATADDVARAVEAAQRAFAGWAATPAPSRGAMLTRAASILESRVADVARDLTREEGKTIAESTGEVRRAVDVLRYYGGEGWRIGSEVLPSAASGQMLFTKREPIGVVGVVSPWNFPIAIPAWKIAPALVAGNTVVFKPASLTPLTATHLVRAIADAEIPPGVLNLVLGSGGLVGDALVGHANVDAISFTGSTLVGKHIYELASGRMARVQLEMGGKNPFVVAEDASIKLAASLIAQGGWGLTGQACTATSRVIAVGKIVEPLVEALKLEASARMPGNGLDPAVRMGPVVDTNQLATDLDFVESGRRDATLAIGGRHLGDLLVEPTLFIGADRASRIARDEIFGPVISIIEARDIDEAINIANDTEYGLSAGICTNNMAVAHHFIDRIEAGVVKVNQATSGLEHQMPFGGVKSSSTGTFREQGSTAIDFYTRIKSVYLRYGDYPIT